MVILGLFLLLPILMALFVSFTDWNGQGSPFTTSVPVVGLDNYERLVAEPGLARLDFMTSIRNNLFYVLIVVPTQTVLALFLALVVNQKVLRGQGFFRTAFFFPSVTSSVAISVVFLFIFTNGGAFNAVLLVAWASAVHSGSPTLAGSSTSPCRTPGWSRRRRRS